MANNKKKNNFKTIAFNIKIKRQGLRYLEELEKEIEKENRETKAKKLKIFKQLGS